MSAIVDYTDRTTCILFGDGAGAVLLEPSETHGVIDHKLHVDGAGAQMLRQRAGGSLHPPYTRYCGREGPCDLSRWSARLQGCRERNG